MSRASLEKATSSGLDSRCWTFRGIRRGTSLCGATGDRTLICGDVFLNVNFYTTLDGLHEPPGLFTVDMTRNRQSARRLAELEPQLVLFGNGKPLRDPARLKAFTDSLPGGLHDGF